MRMKDISRMFNIDEKTLYWWRKRREKNGNVKAALGYQKGHSHKIKELDSFVKFLEENQDITINKLIEKFGNMHKNTVYNYLKKLGIHIKKTFLYQERDEEKRKEFREKVGKIKEENLIFIDETGIDDNEFYKYGWAKKGKRLFSNKPAYKNKRVSIIGALNQGKVLAPCVFEGHCNSELFEAYVENILVPILKPGQTIILDNASFHKSKRIKKLIEYTGCTVLFLPPYSPDLNPIEHFWFAIKHSVRKVLPTFCSNIHYSIDFVFQKSGEPFLG
jgi:transposase